jgi:hypothetical protein
VRQGGRLHEAQRSAGRVEGEALSLTMRSRTNGSAGAAGGDGVGKVFLALSGRRRLCLICDGIFTPEDAADHAMTPCRVNAKPSQQEPAVVDFSHASRLGR